jgi:hypothetical protein
LTVLPYQREIHSSNARFRLVDGGRRVGKSKMGGREIFAQMVIPGSYCWVVGPTMDLAEKEFRVAWDLIVDKGNIPVLRKSERELYIKCANGSFLECRSEENPDQLIGEGLDGVVLAEAARLKPRTWDQYIRPALADRRGWALFSSTPRGFNWFEEFYRRGQSTDPKYSNWKSWQIPSRMNPLLGPEEIEEARQTSTPEAYAQEWEAKFIAYGGLVFPEFSEEVHVAPREFVRGLRTAMWIDPGTTAPYAVLLVQITPDERVFVLDEIYRTGYTTSGIISLAEEKWRDYITIGGNPDPELDVIIDKAAAEASATWRLSGYAAHGDKPGIKKGIEVHHMFLRDPFSSTDEVVNPRITWDPRCYNSIREHGQYHYPDNARRRIEVNPSDVPVDVDNHTIDAIRYGYRNTFPELFNETPEQNSVEYYDMDDLDPDIRARVSLGEY